MGSVEPPDNVLYIAKRDIAKIIYLTSEMYSTVIGVTKHAFCLLLILIMH